MHISRENLVKYILHDFHTIHLIEYYPCFNLRYFICVLLKLKKKNHFEFAENIFKNPLSGCCVTILVFLGKHVLKN